MVSLGNVVLMLQKLRPTESESLGMKSVSFLNDFQVVSQTLGFEGSAYVVVNNQYPEIVNNSII